MNYPSFVVLIVLIYKCQSKCVMYDACANLSPLYKGQSPFKAKWQNCEYSGEPQPVHNQHVMRMFKKLCPSLYNGDDNQALCCSANQIRILTKSISEAEAIIGSCPSCYFNFRNFWCQITCHPDQHRFVQPIEYQLAETNNFSHVLHEYEKAKQITDFYDDFEEYEQEETESKHMGYVVSKINVYMNREYLGRLIESCRDVKLYGSDALQGFCGVPAHMCTPEQYAHHMGLEVEQNPFKMNFILNQTEQKTLSIHRTRIEQQQQKEDTVDALIQPVMPQYFMCNQSFQFGDLDYGSRCSCK
ncbi:niemann-pick c1, partial [Brachionus plicatilis]